jgi:hypothetical protein
MTILDILIIYLACGSPFAVRNLMAARGKPTLTNILRSTALALYWPVLIPSAIKRVIARQKVSDAQSSDLVYSPADSIFAESVALRRSLENEGHTIFGEAELSKFRNCIERYIGISAAITGNFDSGPPTRSELFEISGNTDEAVAHACLSRRNRQRLETHQAIARSEFLDAIFRLDAAGSKTAIETGIELAHSVSDFDGENELIALKNGAEGKARAA